jgi:predicted site-specific integrase-resolvase
MARLATEKEAADAVGLELATFRAWVASGKLPKPIADCGKYDLKALDAAIDRISGLGSPTNALDAWRAKGQGNARSA